jgi:hypothetical protein
VSVTVIATGRPILRNRSDQEGDAVCPDAFLFSMLSQSQASKRFHPPLHLSKLLRHQRVRIRRAIEDEREHEGPATGHVIRAIDCEFPLTPEVAFLARLRVGRDHRHEQVTGLDLPSDQRIPGIAAAKLALVESHLDARGAKGIAQVLCGSRVLRCIAQEHRPAPVGHGALITQGV